MTHPKSEGELDRLARALPADLEACVAGLVNALNKGVAGEVAPYSLSPLEFDLLRICMEMDACTATDLARVLPVDASRISRIVVRLVDMDLLVRRRLRSDRRIVMLRLSGEGKELVSTLDRRIREYQARLTGGVSEEEMVMLASITSKILANYAAIERPQ